MKSKTISDEMLRLNKELHADPRGFGGDGAIHFEAVRDLIEKYKCWSLLDYGCGQGLLKKALKSHGIKIMMTDYDPAIKGCDILPIVPYDMVTCTDVLEHIEPEYLDEVLKHIGHLAQKVIYLVICCLPANKILSDGRNAHLITEDPYWWMNKITNDHFPGFRLHEMTTSPDKTGKVCKKVKFTYVKCG